MDNSKQMYNAKVELYEIYMLCRIFTIKLMVMIEVSKNVRFVN